MAPCKPCHQANRGFFLFTALAITAGFALHSNPQTQYTLSSETIGAWVDQVDEHASNGDFGQGAIYLVEPVEVGARVDPNYWANVSVHRHPWLATALTIAFLMSMIMIILLGNITGDD